MNDTEQRPQTPSEAVQFHYPVIAPLVMCSGVGDGKNSACVMTQAATIDALRKGLTLEKPTDEMECACPVLRRLAIRANDAGWWEDDMDRTNTLRPWIALLLDSRGDHALTQKRAFFVADNCVRVLTPMRLEFIAAHTKSDKLKEHTLEGAKALRELPPIVDKATAMGASEVCRKFKAYADTSADTSASASASAVAYTVAAASADTDTDAYAYTDAYTDTDAYTVAKEQRLKYRAEFMKLFEECAALRND